VRRYETIFIADPVFPEDELASFREAFGSTITEHKGAVIQEEDWGNRKLAYEVDKHREGHYVRFEYSCDDNQLPAELERRLRISESILRFLTVRIDDDKKRLVWEERQAERAARRAAEAAVRAEAAEAAAAAAADAPPETTELDAASEAAPAATTATGEEA